MSPLETKPVPRAPTTVLDPLSKPSVRTAEFNYNGSVLENLIRVVVKKYGSPVMLIRRNMLEKQLARFKRALPQVIPFYAIKANPCSEIIKTFSRLGTGFDVASAQEMNAVLSLGVPPKKIIFANTIKSIEDIQTAHRRKVRLMTFDNEPELYKIAKYAPGSSVLLRVKVANIGSMVELSLKFGADPEHAIFLLRKAKALGLVPEGLSFHVGSQCTNFQTYLKALEISAAIFKESDEEGLSLRLLDIGGGFPIPHFDHEPKTTFETIARKVRTELARLFPNRVRLIAEPGRFLVGPAGILITQVIGRTFRNNKNFYYLNDGLYADFSGIVFDHGRYELKTLRRGQKFLSTVAGPTCDSFDTISISEELPELDVGSVVYTKNIGAYSSASAVANFNGFPPARIVIV